MRTTNALLAVIALLLACIAYQLHLHRPVTLAELQALAAKGDEQALAERREQIPLARIENTDETEEESDEPPASNSSSAGRASAPPAGMVHLALSRHSR